MKSMFLGVVLLLGCAFFMGSCGNDDSSGKTDGGVVAADALIPMLDASADFSERANGDAVDPLDDLPDIADDGMTLERPAGCEPGNVECKYNGKAERRCVQNTDDTWG